MKTSLPVFFPNNSSMSLISTCIICAKEAEINEIFSLGTNLAVNEILAIDTTVSVNEIFAFGTMLSVNQIFAIDTMSSDN